MLKPYKYWIEKDTDNIAIEENEKIHKKQLEKLSSPSKIHDWLNGSKTYFRKRTLDKLELFLGKEVFGDVIEVGAGTGWCSALLSKKNNINKIYAVDFDEFSLEHLMPPVFDALNANQDKIERIVGDFDNIGVNNNSIDFVFGMGALHHSQNLKLSFSEFYRVLKPGGFVLLSEPTYSNSLSLYDEYKWREGLRPNGAKGKDNGDQMFRVSQWESNALESGFEIYPFLFDKTGFFNRIYSFTFGNSIIKKKKTYSGFKKTILHPYFGKLTSKFNSFGLVELFYTPGHDKLMMIMQKPETHSYKAMSENVYRK